MTVKYEEYNGTTEKAHLLKTEEILVDSNKFNKLVYSNIDGIFHLSKYNPNVGYEIEDIKYNLLIYIFYHLIFLLNLHLPHLMMFHSLILLQS